MDIIIRPADRSDIPEMCGLLSELFSLESDFSPDINKQAMGLALLVTDRSGLSAVFVAEKAGDIIGMCSVQTLISTAQGGAVGLLEDLIVRKEERGDGAGARLLSEVTAWCENRNISRIQLLRDADNKRARGFYTRNGWASTRLVCMRKML